MADCIDGIWDVIRSVILVAFVLALCGGIAFSAVAFLAGQERERQQQEREAGWRTVCEYRLDKCETNGQYRIQIKEH